MDFSAEVCVFLGYFEQSLVQDSSFSATGPRLKNSKSLPPAAQKVKPSSALGPKTRTLWRAGPKNLHSLPPAAQKPEPSTVRSKKT